MGQLGEGLSVELLAALEDPSDTVFLAAVAQLNKQSWALLHTGLDAKLDRDWHALSDKRRHALMRLRPKWQQVAYLLARLTTEPSAQVFWVEKVNLWCEEHIKLSIRSRPDPSEGNWLSSSEAWHRKDLSAAPISHESRNDGVCDIEQAAPSGQEQSLAKGSHRPTAGRHL